MVVESFAIIAVTLLLFAAIAYAIGLVFVEPKDEPKEEDPTEQ